MADLEVSNTTWQQNTAQIEFIDSLKLEGFMGANGRKAMFISAATNYPNASLTDITIWYIIHLEEQIKMLQEMLKYLKMHQ